MKYNREQMVAAAQMSKSMREIALRLGLNESGGTFLTMKRRLKEWEIDTSHFLGKGARKGTQPHNAVLLDDVLENRAYLRSSYLKEKLLKAGKLEYRCLGENCGLVEWHGKPLVLELEHVDGNKKNNSLDNLKLLCPNCHSQTDTWRNRKRRGGGMADPQH